MALTAEQTQRLTDIQQIVVKGDIPEAQERELLREAFIIMRQDRVGAQVASTTSKTKKAEASKQVDVGSVLAGLKASLNQGKAV